MQCTHQTRNVYSILMTECTDPILAALFALITNEKVSSGIPIFLPWVTKTFLARFPVSVKSLGSLSSDVFERLKSTGNGLFAHLSRDFEQSFGQIVPLRIKTLGNTNTVA